MKRPALDQLIPATLFAALGVGVLAFFVLVAEPPERPPRGAPMTGYSEEALNAALQQDGFAARFRDIMEAGQPVAGERIVGRYTGSPGFYRTEQLISNVFAKAGLEILTQELPVVVPVTEVCELLDADGQVIPDVQLYPLQPAGLLPVALPPAGITAELVAVEKPDLRYLNGHQPEATIALTGIDQVDGWQSLAGVGVRALLIREDEAARAMRADRDQASEWKYAVALEEVEFPRILVRGNIDRYVGRQITLRAKVTWQTRYVRNYFGVLRGNDSSKEALILSAPYDSSSIIPDVAPGAEQAVSLAALLDDVVALAPYRGQLPRDIVFVATAGHAQTLAGATRLLEAVEPFTERQPGGRSLERRRAEHQQQLVKLAAPEVPADVLTKVTGEINLERRADAMEARLAYLRAGSPVYRAGFDSIHATDAERKDEANSHPLLRAYLAAKERENQSANLMTTPWAELVKHPRDAEWQYADRCRQEIERRRDYHAQQVKELGDTLAVRTLLGRYERTLTLNLELNSGGAAQRPDLAVLVGIAKAGAQVEPQVTDLANLLRAKAGARAFDVISWGAVDAAGQRDKPNKHSAEFPELESEPWFLCGRLAFTVVNYDFVPPKLGTPEDTPDDLKLDLARQHTRALARAVLAMGYRQLSFKNIQPDPQGQVLAFRGRVVSAAGAGGLVASHPMGDRTFVRLGAWWTRNLHYPDTRSIRLGPVLMTDPMGRYELPLAFACRQHEELTADAARFGKDGRVAYFKDASPAAQSVHKTDRIVPYRMVASKGGEVQPINIEVFPATPVALYPFTNPQTQQLFKRIQYLSRTGLASPRRFAPAATGDRWLPTVFLEPDLEFYVGLMDGAAGNDKLLEYRAFLLNVDPQSPIGADEPELWGRGYRAADTPVLSWPALDAAASMARTAEKRLRLQRRYGMADAQMLGFHQRVTNCLAEARSQRAAGDISGATDDARSALAFAINNQPVIRQRISQAVVGILWYLGLLVPFVFFAEKLAFGFPDIRKQLLAVGILFVAVFILLRLLHPAFQMVRAPLVILLGFVILLLTLLVTLMVGGKFRQNLKDLRRAEGQVEGADISRSGVVGTAFMLGLNNMRRRKVRTGLTCVTLVLITFVMICFTSVSTNLVSEEYPVGRSPWNGILIRNQYFLPVEQTTVTGVQQTLGARYPVTAPQWLQTHLKGIAANFQNAEIIIDREFLVNETRMQKRARISAAWELTWREPEFSGMDKMLLTTRGWFPRPPQTQAERGAARQAGFKDKKLVILPDTIARDLGLSVEDVNAGNAAVNIRGDDYEVLGIIDSAALDRLRSPDGRSPLPYDLNSVQSFGRIFQPDRWVVPDNVQALPAAQVILVNKLPLRKPGEEYLYASVNVLFPPQPYRVTPDAPELPGLDYKAQRQAVLDYLERSGKHVNYAIDGTAYYGARQRTRTLSGMLELLVPLLLAALTVFNTMRSSVYERKNEIYVYNAVGIAPNHVFFIFMAEALVYAVAGAMCGYLLSQASGRALTALGMTGGLNMDYSSIETIYASLAIVVAVMLSTILPARDAARLAAPAETRSWDLPSAEADTLEFALPFTFTAHDRVAVVSYFWRWLDAHGAGSSGAFFCAPPSVQIQRNGELVPGVVSTVWLKPYDLGVSQRMEISLPMDPETGEYIARVKLERLSGHTASWQRTLKPFIGTVRKQFLNWRVTTPADRQEMYAEAKRRLQEAHG